MVKVINQDQFEREVLEASGKVLVDFWATWCGPCRMQGPIIEELSEDMAEERPDVKFCKIDVDENMDIAAKYGIQSIPTMIVFENGQPVKKVIGLTQKAALESYL